ncbi:putative ring-cleaving dioxygenase MhqO [Sporosarcina sp. NCCP-2222]|uniref:ring-cleaving dioxygenase n=1 Tax=Sporosarcina sp. NCCP-2222 TaxID=2935073 RepID=UPI0020872986|nr:ring-cleaving dioxygenase [Sporosarcina sp. NCCP-2222]GKV55175.1 putative ring-cleaving dioxygenase MhqO [Sporosarcina sp. NCCP-2222]
MKKTAGIHHITAIVGHPQENTDFYAGVLGLRLVKKTVNFDDPGTYHLYFGNEAGEPGTIMTFFNWAGAYQGKIGDGQVGVTAFAIPKGSFSFWEERLQSLNIPFTIKSRFNERYLSFSDPHGLQLELVERGNVPVNSWSFSGISPKEAINGFAVATLLSSNPEETAGLLLEMGFEQIGKEDDMVRFQSEASIGNQVDLKLKPTGRGSMGVGVVHHIAFRAIDDYDQQEWSKLLRQKGFHVTPVQDRNYFNSIYFQESGEILFEIATDPPGFAVDESLGTMGSSLMLPPQYEQYRDRLNSALIPFTVRERRGNE